MAEERKYEELFAQLEQLVSEIEKPERSLESISKDVSKALELISLCRECLKGDKEKIDKLLEQ